ncbi:ABC transporter ATP-binding protein [Micromonospora endolithica]|uniref:ABC transporter ATP-binding protein n=1 Tax=Micromonospora endolithica TaxID=230091 RepID=A0A3A9ZMF0_9ACTN|nr:ABC transporter ATP-binding protein [Micromonospora endolithica]RKN49481.1 ABC transporter ATP-binding protein [Micromonospora endolithica]TWJ23685.1 ATP-binding cassette subfamily B protein [Micromonospora endolithica]
MNKVLRSVGATLASAWRLSPGRLITAALLMMLGAVSGPLLALFLGVAVDAALDRRTDVAVWTAAAAAVSVLLSLTMEHFAHIFFFELGDLHKQDTERQLGDLAHGPVGLALHERRDAADRFELLRQQSWTLGQSVQTVLAIGVLLTQITLTAVLLARIEPWLLLLPIFGVPPLIAGRLAEKRLERAELATAESTRMSWHLFDLALSSTAAKEIRLFGLGGELRRRHAAVRREVDSRLRRAELAGAALRFTGQLIFALGYIGSIVLVVRAAVSGERTVGDVVLAITLAVQTNAQAAGAVALAQALQRNARAFGWLSWIRDATPPESGPPADQTPPAVLTDGIELRDVAFRYPGTDTDVLRGLSMRIPSGTIVAIVGDNGSGKSTLVKLLCQFYRPTAGEITIDGVDLRRLDPLGWRQRISASFQDYIRLELRARSSIGLGDLPRLDEPGAVERAIRRADAEGVIDRLPIGLETYLGKSYDNGAELSGGQWQRIALSRAMMRDDPLLLLLDEPAAALDPLTEHALFDRYSDAARDVGIRTGGVTVFVSHRFSTVRMADLILVVSDGRIAESGSHDELLALNGMYAEFFSQQADAYR